MAPTSAAHTVSRLTDTAFLAAFGPHQPEPPVRRVRKVLQTGTLLRHSLPPDSGKALIVRKGSLLERWTSGSRLSDGGRAAALGRHGSLARRRQYDACHGA